MANFLGNKKYLQVEADGSRQRFVYRGWVRKIMDRSILTCTFYSLNLNLNLQNIFLKRRDSYEKEQISACSNDLKHSGQSF